MSIDLSGRGVFLASPGNLSTERADCRRIVREFNELHAEPNCVTFMVKGWEQVSGGVGRPQARINPKVDDCDFMVLLMGDRWGSPTATEGGYTSGTEEEFHRGLALLEDPHSHMRDILVMFKSLPADRLSDPGDQLKQVLEFKRQLEASKAILFETFDSPESLRTGLTKKLNEWMGPIDTPVSISVDMTLGSELSDPSMGATTLELVETAKKQAREGLLIQAELTYAHAIRDREPFALIEFAKFMRRDGRLDRALDFNREALATPELLTATDPESVATKVNALANIGVIERKLGNLTGSRDSLREALQTARSAGIPVNDELCYALDNYGLTLVLLDEDERASRAFQEAYDLRKEFGSSAAIAQSAVNLGRAKLVLGEFGAADVYFREALERVGLDVDDQVRANALCGLAEVELRSMRTDGVGRLLTEALELNERSENSAGLSISHGLLGRLALATGDLLSAWEHAEMCTTQGEKSQNYSGLGVGEWLLAEIAVAEGKTKVVQEHLGQASEYSNRARNRLLDEDIESTRARLLDKSV